MQGDREPDDLEDEQAAPWEEDPLNQLPAVVEPGRINLVLWSLHASDSMKAYDVHFIWDGGMAAQWYNDISSENEGLSVMSSAPISGTVTWGGGDDLRVTYRSSDLGLYGESVLKGAAPTAGRSDYVAAMREPQVWIAFAETMLEFVFDLMD